MIRTRRPRTSRRPPARAPLVVLLLLAAPSLATGTCGVPASLGYCKGINYPTICYDESANEDNTASTLYSQVSSQTWSQSRAWLLSPIAGTYPAAQAACNTALSDMLCTRAFPACDLGYSTCGAATDNTNLKICQKQCFDAAFKCGTPPSFMDCYNVNYTQPVSTAPITYSNCTSSFTQPMSNCSVPTGLTFCTEVNYAVGASISPAASQQAWKKQDDWAREVFNANFQGNPVQGCRNDAKSVICALMFQQCANSLPYKVCRSQCTKLNNIGSCGVFTILGANFKCDSSIYSDQQPCTSLNAIAGASSSILPALSLAALVALTLTLPQIL